MNVFSLLAATETADPPVVTPVSEVDQTKSGAVVTGYSPSHTVQVPVRVGLSVEGVASANR